MTAYDSSDDAGAAARVFLRPVATPLPMGFLALALATAVFGAVQLDWIRTTQAHVAGLIALVLAAPLQLLASLFGYLARDPVTATGMAVLSGTWALLGLTTLLGRPGSTSSGLGVLLLAVAAFYAALALELEGAKRHTILPTGRTGLAAKAERGEKVFDSAELAREPGVRPRL